jgi:hypothetical protein
MLLNLSNERKMSRDFVFSTPYTPASGGTPKSCFAFPPLAGV